MEEFCDLDPKVLAAVAVSRIDALSADDKALSVTLVVRDDGQSALCEAPTIGQKAKRAESTAVVVRHSQSPMLVHALLSSWAEYAKNVTTKDQKKRLMRLPMEVKVEVFAKALSHGTAKAFR